ncbi:MAG: 2-amino-4-hydroxy-6-hydroxymethyldihydropteridine diphosphokinase [Tissierellia bacterium]|nr:2-amino-4-hydroxy-6-hydroxymethyldihydropteridine diphosphokinase [Tissierellia bacterium]
MSPAQVYLSLGSNQGEKRSLLQEAVKGLNDFEKSRVLKVSTLYETKAWGKTDQDDFYNLVLLMETELEPLELLDRTQALEIKLGRVRHEHWGPRTIDIDLLLYEDIEILEPRLTLPHRHMLQRRFVLEPLAEIAPGLCLHKQNIKHYIEVLKDEPIRKIGPLF